MPLLQRAVGGSAAAGRATFAWLALAACGLSMAGCNLLGETHRVFFLTKRTTKLEPKYFPYVRSERLASARDRNLARQVWDDVVRHSPPGSFSRHYARGFVEGFADYMYRGGTGQPPLAPPRSYWHMTYQSADGKQAISDWYEGFRQGSQECEARGYRDLIIVPSSLREDILAARVDSPLSTDRTQIPPGQVPTTAVPTEEFPESTDEVFP